MSIDEGLQFVVAFKSLIHDTFPLRVFLNKSENIRTEG